MAKKAVKEKVANDVFVYSRFYNGLLSEMPQEVKDKIKNEDEKAHKAIFREIEPEPETVNE